MMAVLGLILFFIIPGVYLYSLFKPAKFGIRTAGNPSGKHSRLKFTGITVLVWLLVLAVGSAFTDPEPATDEPDGVGESEVATVNEPVESAEESEQATAKADVADEQVVPTPKEATLGLTPDEYGERYMAVAKEIGLGDYEWGGVELQEGAINDTFTIKLSEAISLLGVVAKNGELKSLTYIMGKTSEGDKEGVNMLMLAGISARALSPELPKEQTAGVVGNLLSSAVDKFSKEGEAKESKVVGDVKYTVIANKVTGLWIVFSDKDS